MSVEMTETGHTQASPAASQGLFLKQNGNQGSPAFLTAGSDVTEQGTIAICIVELMTMNIYFFKNQNKHPSCFLHVDFDLRNE